jgi:hypothetical protein
MVLSARAVSLKMVLSARVVSLKIIAVKISCRVQLIVYVYVLV